MEEWKIIQGFESYAVSNLGNVTSYRRKTFKVLKCKKVYKGVGKRYYWGFNAVAPDGARKTLLIHNEVLKAFVGPRPNGMVACHKDDNVDHNYLDNLEWNTQSHNVKTAVNKGRVGFKQGPDGRFTGS